MDEPELVNPYPGLRPFLANETHLFFGRDEHRIELLQRLRQTRFLAVVGTSGSGKSSLVRAGLLPGLLGGFMAGQGRRWRIADLRPGTDPIGNLARALDQVGALREQPLDEDESSFTVATLRRSSLGLMQAVDEARLPASDTLLVLVDQFEELFRGLESGGAISHDDAAAFVKLLLAASTQAQDRIYVMLTMRSDFLGDCARFRGLPEAINAGQYLVPRLTRDQIREAITGPAAVRGVMLASSLLDRLLNDVADNPDQLPILQHALMRTWDQWVRRRDAANVQIEIDDFDTIGGMRQALNRHADEVLAGLSFGLAEAAAARRQFIAQRLFKALVDTAPNGREVRRLARLSELAAIAGATPDEIRTVVAPFREPHSAFLMPPASEPLRDDDQLDISHESLIRNWLTLQRWRLEESESGEQYRRLADTATRYKLRRAGLWGDPDLREALVWREVHQPNTAWAERYGGRFDDSMAFLNASHARQVEADSERLRGQRVRRALALGVLALAIYAVLSWVMADLLLTMRQAEQVKRSTDGLEFSTKLSQAAAERRSGKPAGQIAACGDVASLTDSHVRELWMRVCDPESPPIKDEEALMQAHELVALLAQGRIDEAASGAQELPGYLAIQVHDVMTRLADLTTAAIRSEQRILQLTYAQARGDKPRQLRATSLARMPQSFDHPVHRSLASKIANHEPLSSGEEWLLGGFRHSKDASKADDETDTALRCVPPGMEGAEAVGSLGTDTFFRRMCLASLQPVSWLADPARPLVQLVDDWGSDLVLLLAWPIWGLWRWRRQRAGARFDAPPSTLRRALAAHADVTLAILAAAPFFLLGISAADLAVDSVIAWMFALLLLLTGVVAFAGYLLFCDAIAFRHYRSLGKIAFCLRPVRDDGSAPRAISLAESARRNATFTISTVAGFGVIVGITFSDPLVTENPWIDVAMVGTLLLAVWVPMYLLRGRTWGDRWSGTRVVDVRSALGYSVSAKPDSLPGVS